MQYNGKNTCAYATVSYEQADKIFLRLTAARGSHAHFDNLCGLFQILIHAHHTIHTCKGSLNMRRYLKVRENVSVTVAQMSLCVCYLMLHQPHTICCSVKAYTICYAIILNKQSKSTISLYHR
jgi:hypothetical protein